MTFDELYDAFEAEEQAGWDRRRAIFLKAVAHARNEALEEAVKVAETTVPPFTAAAIRALITKGMTPEGSCLPKPGDKLGTRTVICVKSADCIVFGEREGGIENCGAYVTDIREWLDYERTIEAAP